MDLNLRGTTALITGASRGIGVATAETLAEEGCNLRLVARSEIDLSILAKRLATQFGVEVTIHAGDIRDPSFRHALVADAGDADILVNNAGDIPMGAIEDIDEQLWRQAWELKVFGYIALTRLMYLQMKERRQGVIVNNIGVAGEWFDGAYIAGSTGNAALIAFTRSLGGRSLAHNVRVVGVNPGPVSTDRLVALLQRKNAVKSDDQTQGAELFASFPNGRAARPREIADMIAFLASDRSGYTSGVVMTIDGGMGARGR